MRKTGVGIEIGMVFLTVTKLAEDNLTSTVTASRINMSGIAAMVLTVIATAWMTAMNIIVMGIVTVTMVTAAITVTAGTMGMEAMATIIMTCNRAIETG